MDLLDSLNEMQREAVQATEGPLLILAGAGSGKTRVLTHRAAFLVKEMGIDPYNIMAITFTNKAAGEMRERIDQMVGFGADRIWVATFHSTCVRILRRYIDRLGYSNSFTIYDADDQKSLIKAICKALEIDTKLHKERSFMSAISSAKDELIDPDQFESQAAGDYSKRLQADVYREYQKRLKSNHALDFDDLIMKTVELFRQDKEVLRNYQNRFRYLMVDEYQDTNTAQFELIRLLASGSRNLCVVGDDDQSIYRFRGANINNILNFEKYYEDARVIRLEQNYRSTQNILDAANSVIANNIGRKEKKLWTASDAGELVRFERLNTGGEEADFIAGDIRSRVRDGGYQYRDCAVLYRTNVQSRVIEESFLNFNIPYKVVGGVNFYARKEIKDILAYLKTIDNGSDDLAVRRIINVPKRGIGNTSINRALEYAMAQEMDFFQALVQAKEIPSIGKAVDKLERFVLLIRGLRTKAKESTVSELIREILDVTGYVKELEQEGTDEADERIANIDELISKAVSYEEAAGTPTLQGFLEEVSLVADIDSVDPDSDYVVLMTLHSAKGLEFANVYLAGMEDGLFPSYMSITSEEYDPRGFNPELEEERRIAYVGITRAREHLCLTAARSRMVRGENRFNRVSRFVEEIPKELIDVHSEETEEAAPQKNEKLYQQQTAFQLARKAFRAAPAYAQPAPQKDFGSPELEGGPGYKVGDRVRHMKFGEGNVTGIVSGGRDYEVTVDFDKAGTKKMFASFAKLKKL